MSKKKIEIKKGKSASKDINVTPLIDVVLVLLIIFMVITPIVINEMAANLPDKTETVEQQELPKDQLIAAVYEDGSIALNMKVVTIEELNDEVRKRLRSKSQKVVFVDAHPDANYARVVAVMDSVRDAGADKVGLASMKDEGPRRPEDAAAAEEGTEAPAAP